jgi:zinc/manganese transport system substrate-binding protein
MIRVFTMTLALFVAAPIPLPKDLATAEPTDPTLRAPLRVVTTLPIYATLTRAIGGDEVEVTSIANPNEDAHFVRPKPSFALDLRRADMFVTTGLDLELWVPTLLDKAGNAKVSEGGQGYVTAYTGVTLLDVPSSVDRSAGDVHIYGNPHLTTDPLRVLQVAQNITTGLKRVAPDRSATFDRGLERFRAEVHRRLFGPRLVELLGGDTLERLARAGTLFDFLRENALEEKPLIDELGGWLKAADSFRGRKLICYHKNWAYLEQRFELMCADYVESKPGIAPTPRHVAQLIEMMKDEGIRVLLAAAYFDGRKVESVASRGGAIPVVLTLQPPLGSGADGYFAMVDGWIRDIADAFRRAGG